MNNTLTVNDLSIRVSDIDTNVSDCANSAEFVSWTIKNMSNGKCEEFAEWIEEEEDDDGTFVGTMTDDTMWACGNRDGDFLKLVEAESVTCLGLTDLERARAVDASELAEKMFVYINAELKKMTYEKDA